MEFYAGTSLILWLQQYSPTLDWPFKAITLLGSEPFFLLFLPLIYWCIHRPIGARLAILFLLSAAINAIAKFMFGMPRPFAVDPSVLQLAAAGGNGFPSGHTQGAVVVWSYLAIRFDVRGLWWLAGTFILFIPLSRLYLGVHFPVDLAGGYFIGGLLVLVYLKTEPPLAEMMVRCQSLTLVTLLSLATAAAAFLVKDTDPYTISTVAALVGTSLGILMERRWIGFQVDAGPATRTVHYLIGLAGLLVIYIGLKIAFAGLAPHWLFRFIRYGLLGLWTAGGAPLLFKRQKPIQ
jgi:membrane-associated phospholipid phosphatase